MYFGIGHRSSENEALIQFQKFPLQFKLVFNNNDHQCILGAFMEMCCEVLHSLAHEQLLNDFPKFAKNCLLEIGLPKILAESQSGILKKEKI